MKKRTWKKIVLTYVIAGVVLFLLVGLAIRMLESRVLYHPWPLEGGQLEALAKGFPPASAEEVSFSTEDGITISGWLGTPKEPRATLLWFHGNAGNVLHRWECFRRFVQGDRYRVLIVDYRGFGLSEGSPSEEGLYLDARAALDFLASRGIPSTDVWLLGRSLGGAVAVELATARPVRGLIMESTFTSAKDMAREMIPFFPVAWFTKSRFDSRERIATLTIPILMFHGRQDGIVPFSHAQRLASAAVKSPPTLVTTDSGHNDLWASMGKNYFETIREFMEGEGTDR